MVGAYGEETGHAAVQLASVRLEDVQPYRSCMSICVAEATHQEQCPIGWELPRTDQSVPGRQLPCCALQHVHSLHPHSNEPQQCHRPVHVPALHTGTTRHFPDIFIKAEGAEEGAISHSYTNNTEEYLGYSTTLQPVTISSPH